MTSRIFRAAAFAGALLVAGLAQAQAPAPKPLATPSAADFGALPMLSGPEISPDGKRIAAKGLLNGKHMVVISDLTAPDRKLSRFDLLEKHELNWVRWAGNDRVLVGLSRLGSLFGFGIPMTRVAMLDLARGTVNVIGPSEQGFDGDSVIHVARDGSHVLLATQPSMFQTPAVFRVDLATNKSERVVKPQAGVWTWYADSAGVVRAGLGSEGLKWWVVYRATARDDFKRVIRRDRARDADRDDGIQQFVPVIGSDLGYTIADGKAGHLALYRFDFTANQLGELIYEHPEVDVDNFVIDPESGALRAVLYTNDRAEIAWFDPELKKIQANIDRALPGAINRIESLSEDKMRLLVWSQRSDEPGVYYLYDRAAKRMEDFARPHDALRDKQLSGMQPVRYKARDGLEIRAYLTLPAGKESAKGLPLVVMPHGGPAARDAWGYEPWVQYLASRGYAVLQPNYRGSTGFGRAFVEKGQGAWGRAMQDDVDDGVKWLVGQGIADAGRVCIMGASFGGYMAMWAAVRNPELYRCAISFAGVSDIATMLNYSAGGFAARRYFRDWRERIKGDKGFNLDTISPLKAADRMTVPIFIAHGADDGTVPLIQSSNLHDALVKIGREHEYMVYKGEGHGFSDPKNSTDFLNRVGEFLKKHNPN